MNRQLAQDQPDQSDGRGRFEGADLRMRITTHRGETPQDHEPVIGQSDVWQRALARALRVASTDATVLLQGESGTGKEVVARFIHAASPRKSGPFVPINCAALPETLFESELFGFERGAFTGAQQAKPGQIELANGGVLFLDEVTELPLTAQVKLLRVLQEREFIRLGGTRPIRVTVRVIAATNQDVRSAVAQGRFREDLYYRINVFDVSLPPLRERGRDILLLAHYFLNEFAPARYRSDPHLAVGAEEALLAYHWPGNVRELRNVLERATILCERNAIEAEHLSLAVLPRLPSLTNTDLRVLERQAIEQALREAGGNKAKAAQKLGISRTQLYSRLRKHELHNV
jgi:transcriptional regulator with PAS, ATPase and Fis domain